MIDYSEDKQTALIDGNSFRRDKKTGYFLSSRPIKYGKRIRLHVYVWCKYNGDVPKGYSIHHKDEDKYNNDISNLQLMSNSEHTALHAQESVLKNYDKIVKNLKENAIPKSKEWHKSKEGHEWHKKHYEDMKDKMYVLKEFTCLECGKKFSSKKYTAKFCCNSCKSAYRRKSGVDDIMKVCESCGRLYKSNKYQRTKHCELCRDKKHTKSREK